MNPFIGSKMIFRIHNMLGISFVALRSDGGSFSLKRWIKKANFIRNEVNGSNDRRVPNYTKSLAAYLLKYNNLVQYGGKYNRFRQVNGQILFGN